VTGLIVAFFGTNVDGLLCLAAAFAVDPPASRVRALAAATAAFALLLLTAYAVSLAIGRLPVGAVAWFGLVPIGIGVVRLVHGIRVVKRPATQEQLSSESSVFSIVLATGADNVAVYAPLLAIRPFFDAMVLCIAYLLLWLLACAALVWFEPDVPRIHALKRYLEPALAIFFIAIGIAIVLRGGALL
jgi:cadmium resistance protein CadD (predicted permease)